MGGDGDPKQVERLACFVRGATAGRLKTAWYSGCQTLPDNCLPRNFDFIKLGSYVEHLGGLDSPTTNQRFYQIENEAMIDITEKFQKLQER